LSFAAKGMQRDSDTRKLIEEFRRLAVEDPLRARDGFLHLMHSGSSDADALLEMLSAPGEGRLRQIIANAVHGLPVKERLIPFLIEWRESETDEFAFRAINSALADQDLTSYKPAHVSGSLTNANTIQAYRYVSSRISHKLRNALLNPEARFIRLRSVLKAASDPHLRAEILSLVGELSDDLQRIGTIVEFTQFDPKHFDLRAVMLHDWLLAMNDRYAAAFAPIRLTIEANGSRPCVYASDYLLETIFWNIWMNAQQAIGQNCAIVVEIKPAGGSIEVIVVDNGEGFPQKQRDIAFKEAYSSSGSTDRGVGLLEVQDAVERLHGKVGLIEHRPGEYRIKILFPRRVYELSKSDSESHY
jgi:signal transduction histidine kinase